MEGLKVVIQAITVVIAAIIYIGIWWSLVINWDRYISTSYSYPCFEKYLSKFYDIWITIHIGIIAFIFVWAWC